MPGVSDLIDTTEMYLRTVFELEEEGVVPLRARIAERLGQSGPTVSQTVARMERDGLLTVEGDRHLELSAHGRSLATRVMRKHRLAECLLVQVIGLDWELVHEEACRWEHVMSDTVERRLLDVLGHPTVSPYGNPIPGLDELGEEDTDPLRGVEGLVTLDRVVDDRRCRRRRTPAGRAAAGRHGADVPAAPGRRPARRVDHRGPDGGRAARRLRRRDHRDQHRGGLARVRQRALKHRRETLGDMRSITVHELKAVVEQGDAAGRRRP